MSATMSPADEFKAALECARELTEAHLRDAMEKLPAGIRDRLARGPVVHRWTCGVCEAFGRGFYGAGAVDLADPRWVVWIYHEAPKVDMTHAGQLHYGERANETYRRCLATYRAAGWDGVAPEANA